MEKNRFRTMGKRDSGDTSSPETRWLRASYRAGSRLCCGAAKGTIPKNGKYGTQLAQRAITNLLIMNPEHCRAADAPS
jgi:hypothetical protein